MEPAHVPVQFSWARSLTTIVIGLVLGLASGVGLLSQWGQPTTNVATASFVKLLLGAVIFLAGCIRLLYKLFYVILGGQ
jgi:uncharacterized membrane protein YeaQ/YmgE (transglycosylase-associated protein family)